MVLKLVLSYKSNITRRAITLAIFVFGLLIVGSMAIPRANAAPSITLNPTSGPTGTTVHIYGSGFTSNGQISSALWNGMSAYSFAADANGNLNTTVQVPDVGPGNYGFTVTDVATQGTTQTQFTVTQSSTSPTPTTTSSATASPSPTPSIPEFQSLLVVLTLFTAVSIAAILMVRKRKTVNSVKACEDLT
jgi:IPT/TIG domain